MKIKKALVYFISFFSLSVMFSACYYISYKNALRDFNESAVERNNEFILSLEKNGYLQIGDQVAANNQAQTQEPIQSTEAESNITVENTTDTTVPVDQVKEDTVLPATQYTLQTYDVKTGVTSEEVLPTPSYLIGLNREEVIQYLNDYMQDLPLNEFQKGLISFEVVKFSKDDITLKKTYNTDNAEYKYYLKAQNGYIIAYYGDQKTVFDYTGVSTENLSAAEQQKLEEGIPVKDLDELYALLENYSS